MLGVVLISVLAGILLTILLQWLFIKRWFYKQPILNAPWKNQYDKFYLPREILEALKDPENKKKKESCLCINLIFQFLFQELKDTRRLRRWVMRRMNMEFTEMLQTTTGKLLDQITVRDFSLGRQFPVIKNICIQNVSLKEETTMEELSLLLDLTYKGGFQLAVDVDMVFGKSAYLSVKVMKIQGRARLQYSRVPFTHWSFSFIEDPVMEFEVESHFEGRPIPQITSLIVNQIRRSVRKKHTLPNYKIRYKPVFVKPEPAMAPQDVYYHGNKLSVGHLTIVVMECNRLVKVVGGVYMYCTLALDSVPWLELMSSRRKLWVVHDIEIIKSQGQNIGLSFKDDYILDRYEEMVVVDVVTPYTPAAYANIKKNDVVVAVGGVKITNTKQAAKLMKQATDKLALRIERSSSLKGIRESSSSPEIRFEEDTISIKDPEILDDPEPSKEDEDYINITLTQGGSNSSVAVDDRSITKEMNGYDGNLDDGTNSSPSKKGFSILSSSTGLFHRKKSKIEKERDSKSPGKGTSPEAKVRVQGQVTSEEGQEQKPKVTPSTKVLTPELLRKKYKDGAGTQGTKEKTKEVLERPESFVSLESLDAISDCPTIEQQLVGHTAVDLKKTLFLPAAEDLTINEKFEFDVEDSHNYLNVCVWCKIPEKLDKQSRVVKPEKDILLGHVSIPLMDIALECLGTLQGDLQMTYKLTPAEMKAGASRNKISSLSAHPGFDEKLCYGDITLEFSHNHAASPLNKLDRENVDKMKQDAELNATVMGSKVDGSLGKLQQTIKRRPPEEGKHDFIGTHFQSATYCNFCHKKIWLKTAFQCQVCGMVCHKKCTERCQAQTICSKTGFQIKEPPSTVFRKSTKEDVKEQLKEQFVKEQASSTRASFLSKFRKERGGSDQGSKALIDDESSLKDIRRPSSPVPPSMILPSDRKRHNSAPDEEHLLVPGDGCTQVHAGKEGLLGIVGMSRTRSSTSISDLIKAKVSPNIKRKKVADESSPDFSGSEDEDDMNMLKVYEQQKAAHSADELVVTAAKEMGKELYVHLDFEERKDKLDGMISKLQQEIDQESENRSAFYRVEREAQEQLQRTAIKVKVEKSEEKIQSLALLMLHYCAGLQHCMEEQEVERQRRERIDESGRGTRQDRAGEETVSEYNSTNQDVAADQDDLDAAAQELIGRFTRDEDEMCADDEESSNEENGCRHQMEQQTTGDLAADSDLDIPEISLVEDVIAGREERFLSLTDEPEDVIADSDMVTKATLRQPMTMSFRALLSRHESDSDEVQGGTDTDSDEHTSSHKAVSPQSFVSCDSDREATDEMCPDPEDSGNEEAMEAAGCNVRQVAPSGDSNEAR